MESVPYMVSTRLNNQKLKARANSITLIYGYNIAAIHTENKEI